MIIAAERFDRIDAVRTTSIPTSPSPGWAPAPAAAWLLLRLSLKRWRTS